MSAQQESEAGKRKSELKDILIDIVQSEEQKEKTMKKSEEFQRCVGYHQAY